MEEKNLGTPTPTEYTHQNPPPRPEHPAQYPRQPSTLSTRLPEHPLHQSTGAPGSPEYPSSIYPKVQPPPGISNHSYAPAPPPSVIYLQPGQQIHNGQVVGQYNNTGQYNTAGQQFGQQQFTMVNTPVTCDKSKMPSLACPIFACLCCWPLGIGAIVYYLRAQASQGNCF